MNQNTKVGDIVVVGLVNLDIVDFMESRTPGATGQLDNAEMGSA